MMLEIGELAMVINARIGRNIGKVVRVTDLSDDITWCIEAEPVVGFIDYESDGQRWTTDEPVWFRIADLMPIDSERLENIDREIAEWQDAYMKHSRSAQSN